MSWQPWSFTAPFIAYTPILAEEMNPKLNGISASFTYVANELNNFVPRLPSNFTGNVNIPNGSYINTLLSIDEYGDVALLDKAAFMAEQNKDFTIRTVSDEIMVVGGDNHAEWIMLNNTTSQSGNIEVIVGPAVSGGAEAVASTIILTQDSELPLVLTPALGVTIKSPGHLTAYGQNSTLTLIALDQYTWLLGGDVKPTELIV